MNPSKNDHEDECPTIFYTPQVNYELTINLPDSTQHFKKKNRANKCVESASAILELMRDVADWELYPELSEPRVGNPTRGSDARWHYHGVIRFHDELAVGEFLLNKHYLLRKSCDYSINSYRKEYWNKYIKKQESIMKPICKSHSIPYILTSNRPQFKSAL